MEVLIFDNKVSYWRVRAHFSQSGRVMKDLTPPMRQGLGRVITDYLDRRCSQFWCIAVYKVSDADACVIRMMGAKSIAVVREAAFNNADGSRTLRREGIRGDRLRSRALVKAWTAQMMEYTEVIRLA